LSVNRPKRFHQIDSSSAAATLQKQLAESQKIARQYEEMLRRQELETARLKKLLESR
jgi:hypothetical protein